MQIAKRQVGVNESLNTNYDDGGNNEHDVSRPTDSSGQRPGLWEDQRNDYNEPTANQGARRPPFGNAARSSDPRYPYQQEDIRRGEFEDYNDGYPNDQLTSARYEDDQGGDPYQQYPRDGLGGEQHDSGYDRTGERGYEAEPEGGHRYEQNASGDFPPDGRDSEGVAHRGTKRGTSPPRRESFREQLVFEKRYRNWEKDNFPIDDPTREWEYELRRRQLLGREDAERLRKLESQQRTGRDPQGYPPRDGMSRDNRDYPPRDLASRDYRDAPPQGRHGYERDGDGKLPVKFKSFHLFVFNRTLGRDGSSLF